MQLVDSMYAAPECHATRGQHEEQGEDEVEGRCRAAVEGATDTAGSAILKSLIWVTPNLYAVFG